MASLNPHFCDRTEDSDQLFRLKAVILGDGTTGKTSLARRFSHSTYGVKYEQTIGIDFFLQQFELSDNTHVTLHVWDIGGQSIGGSMLQTYLQGSDIVLLVYDVTNYNTFANIKDWLSEVKKAFGGNTKAEGYPIVALVANKTDLDYKANIPKEKHLKFAHENSLESCRISAKTNDNVEYCFKWLSSLALHMTPSKYDREEWKGVVKAVLIQEPMVLDRPIVSTEGQRSSVACSLQ
ncbi:Ras-related protein Rab-28 [Oopsacas minuta]|uniref:Ras-related protein Rab-28 n=1 Tax=Oopsacas minuta TaxID=111878 RepID=A0AAV7KHW9_9METZ|nr:Ras-related protein Rab-28 [Oopsacas minuta]